MIDGLPLLYWRRNLGKSGKSRDCKNRIRLQERSYDCTIAQLQTRDQLMMDNAGITKIAYDLRRDLYWRRNLGKSGQSRDCKNRIRLQERSYDCTIVQLQTKDQLMMDNAGVTKIAYHLRRDLTTAQLCSFRQKDQLTSTTGSWAKQGLRKSHTTLGDIVGLHNCAVADITPQLWHDVTLQQRLKCM